MSAIQDTLAYAEKARKAEQIPIASKAACFSVVLAQSLMDSQFSGFSSNFDEFDFEKQAK